MEVKKLCCVEFSKRSSISTVTIGLSGLSAQPDSFFPFLQKKNWFTTPTPTKEMSALTISDSDNVVLPFGKQLAANGKPLVSEIH
jgi:hypothetical protein